MKNGFCLFLVLLCPFLLLGRAEKGASTLVDIQELDPTIRVELKYASPDNFMGQNVYGGQTKAYLQEDAAIMLAKASQHLRIRHPNLSLLVVDALRPRQVQRRMWDLVKGTPRQNYVARPGRGSMHNHGCAVDITLVDQNGNRLDMGTPMDHFGPLAQPRLEQMYLRKGLLTTEQVANRRVLRETMVWAGFRPLPIEWWHFDAFRKDVVRETYHLYE